MPSGNPRWLRPALSDVGFAPLRCAHLQCAFSTVTYLKVPNLRGLLYGALSKGAFSTVTDIH
jgi:hypothetical protein